MLLSMTGYGNSQVSIGSRIVRVEIKSLNSKYLELQLKLPMNIGSREYELRNLIQQQIRRGKVILSCGFSDIAETSGTLPINTERLIAYGQQLSRLAQENRISPPDLGSLLSLPGVVESAEREAGEDEWTLIYRAIRDALRVFDAARAQEGATLAADLLLRIRLIEQGLAQVELRAPERKAIVRSRLEQAFADTRENISVTPDPNRFEQELIYYLEKLDITEEIVRLRQHLTYFQQTMDEAESNGRKLSFIAQEIGREINTIGSKANDATLQVHVVGMKDELEKIKEQLNNIL